jgi:FKBP-type peptidyl-prolyl cis-trans isomerase FklB
VQYKVLKEGNGAVPADTSVVKVHYEGRTMEGNVFDSSYKRGEPTKFRVDQVIKGWTDALKQMPAGSTWEIYVPQELAYGERQQGSDIKPFSMLIFKIELIDVDPKE